MSVIIIDKATRALYTAQAAIHKTLTELNLGVAALVEEQTRIAFITDLYAEQYEQLEKTMDAKSSRPWTK